MTPLTACASAHGPRYRPISGGETTGAKAAVIDRFGPLPPDTILMPGPADYTDRFYDGPPLEGSQPVDAITALIARGEMYAQLLQMPEGSEVVGRETWEDDLGRVRVRLLFE